MRRTQTGIYFRLVRTHSGASTLNTKISVGEQRNVNGIITNNIFVKINYVCTNLGFIKINVSARNNFMDSLQDLQQIRVHCKDITNHYIATTL